MSDHEKTLGELKERVEQFTQSRQWGKAHSPKNLAMSIAIEAAELMEIFQWVESEEAWDYVKDEVIFEHLGEEMADIMIYCLSLANQLDIDVSHIIEDKIVKNGQKYPLPD
ncbi:MAG TPA: nucleotide pyrophosphohydrolase [Pseudogracilibacillus sp.]|nr:nucleotide pyrophosphohydrolase [Pseudogracilibacillus sp.]